MLGALTVFCNIQNDKVINSAIAAGFIAFLLSVAFKETRKSKTLPTVFVFVTIALILLSVSNQNCAALCNKYNGKEIEVSGYLTEPAYKQHGKSYYIIKTDTVNGEKEKIKLRIVSDSPLGLEPTDRIDAKLKVFLLINDDDSYASYYKSKNLMLGAYPCDYVHIEKNESYSLRRLILKLRVEMSKEIQHLLANDYGAVITGLVLGDDSELSDKATYAFRFCGVSHLFAVSGLHISVWSMLIFAILSKVKLSSKKASAVSIVFCIFFMMLTGFNPPVVRSGIMMIMIYIAKLLNLESDAFNSMGLSLIIMLTVNPYTAASLSLQLSVLATSGILIMAQPLTEILSKPTKNLKKGYAKNLIYSIISIISVSISVTVFTIPVYIFNFKYLSILQILSNLLMVSVGSICMQTAGVASLLCVLGLRFLGYPLLIFSGLLSKLLVSTAYFLSSFRYALLPLNTELSVKIILFFLLVAFVFYLIDLNDIALTKLMSIAAVIVFMTANILSFHFNFDKLQLSVADVGNGTAVIMTCKGENIIFCCDGEYFAESAICDIMNKYGINTVDYLCLPKGSKNSESFLDGYEIKQVIDFTADDFSFEAFNAGEITVTPQRDCVFITFNNTNIVVVFSDSIHFENSQCDILIFKSRLPLGIKYRFAVSSYSKNTIYSFGNAYRVSDDGSISLLIDDDKTFRRVDDA